MKAIRIEQTRRAGGDAACGCRRRPSRARMKCACGTRGRRELHRHVSSHRLVQDRAAERIGAGSGGRCRCDRRRRDALQARRSHCVLHWADWRVRGSARCQRERAQCSLPEAISFDVAAASLLKGMTARYLLRKTFRVERGHALSCTQPPAALDRSLVQWAKHLGATRDRDCRQRCESGDRAGARRRSCDRAGAR